jgi:hypothetical protein
MTDAGTVYSGIIGKGFEIRDNIERIILGGLIEWRRIQKNERER